MRRYGKRNRPLDGICAVPAFLQTELERRAAKKRSRCEAGTPTATAPLPLSPTSPPPVCSLGSCLMTRSPPISLRGPRGAAPSADVALDLLQEGRKRRVSTASTSGKGGGKGLAAAAALDERPQRGSVQTYLDLGQDGFGSYGSCPRCGMTWATGEPSDEAEHLAFCAGSTGPKASVCTGIPFDGWKRERVAASWPGECVRVIEIRPGDPAKHLSKVEEVRAMMDADMGFARGGSEAGRRVFLYVLGRRVKGCVIAETISEAFRISEGPCDARRAASVGIYQIWTHPSYRRKGVGTRLLDTVRKRMVWGTEVDRKLLAFSQPTQDGLQLAQSYCKGGPVLTYPVDASS